MKNLALATACLMHTLACSWRVHHTNRRRACGDLRVGICARTLTLPVERYARMNPHPPQAAQHAILSVVQSPANPECIMGSTRC